MQTIAEMWLAANQNKFKQSDLFMIRSKLDKMDESKVSVLCAVELKNPIVGIFLSIFLGTLGIDRFYTGDQGRGLLKLLTGGLCGIYYIIDIFLIMNAVKVCNYKAIQPHLV